MLHENQVIHAYIEPAIHYYRQLTPHGQQKFIERVKYFAQHFEFVGGNDFLITDEMKYLLTCPLAQITFGLHTFDLQQFTRVVVYEEEFMPPRSRMILKGGTMKIGMVLLSWKNFCEGYHFPNDNYNLGLHEFAHVFKICIEDGEKINQQFKPMYEEWERLGIKIFEDMREKSTEQFLREYAETNMHEFFSVCVEYFFEVPQKFLHAHPELYDKLCNLLQQNPLNTTEDYAHVAENETHFNASHAPASGHYTAQEFIPSNFPVIFFIGGAIAIFGWLAIKFLMYSCLISVSSTFAMVATLGIISYTITNFFFRFYNMFSKINIGLFSVIIGGICLTTATLWLNTFFCNKNEYKFTLPVTGMNVVLLEGELCKVIVHHPNHFFDDFYLIRKHSVIKSDIQGQNFKVAYIISEGLFAIPVLKEKTLISIK